MSLNLILSALKVGARTQSVQAWAQTEDLRAGKVARFRRYVDGDHDNHLTTEQKNLLNIRGGVGEDSTAFNDNLCSIILDTMLDRIAFLGVKTDSDTGDQWATDLLERNRIDALQVDVHQAALTDADSYLMVYPDATIDPLTGKPTGKAQFSHEPAYDGAFGTVLMYETSASQTPMLAIKVWKLTSETISDTTRVNVYYPNRIERWIGQTVTGLKPYSSPTEKSVEAWVDSAGQPLGVPFVHFKNRSRTGDNFGVSELDNVTPLQDATNVVLTSVVATALLSGFPIRGLIGAQAPAAVVPGQVLSFFPKDADGNFKMPSGVDGEVVAAWLNAIRFEQFDAADLSKLLQVLAALKLEMYAVTNTPTDDVAANASGEARKQSEIKLIGKVKRFCIKNGNAWEDALRLAARIETVFTTSAPPVNQDTTLTAQWGDAEIRNDSLYADELRKDYQAGLIDQRTYLEGVKEMRGWDESKIEAIIAETEKAKAAEQQMNQEDAQAAAEAMALARAGANGNGNGAASVSGDGYHAQRQKERV